MATRLFLRNTTNNTAGYVGTEKSTALPVGTLDDAGNGARDLETTKGTTQTSVSNVSLAQGTDQDQYMGKWISDPLTGITQIDANTWTLAVATLEGNANANAFTVASVYVLKSDDTVRGFAYDSHTSLGVEYLTTEDGQVLSLTGSAVTGVVSTDRLCVEVWIHAVQAMAVSYTNTLYFDGTTDVVDSTTTDAASYLETPQNGLFSSSVTGTIAVTQAAQTSAITATETMTGTIAVTQAAQTSTISGTVANPVTGTIAVTQAAQTSTITATETMTGTIAVIQANQTSAMSATVTITGTIAVTQAGQTMTASGTVTTTITGTIAVTQGNQTATFTGTVTLVTNTFTPPAREQIQRGPTGLYRHYTFPQYPTVLITGGIVSEQFHPEMGTILAADAGSGYADRAVFLGGRSWTVTGAERVILEAAGYTVT